LKGAGAGEALGDDEIDSLVKIVIPGTSLVGSRETSLKRVFSHF
jgi:hypothetical protein